ncbi:hypothetical protein RHMOL_Rhmol12G0049700 [Rhododendron molle]|uniref:Uncharacterized protein n=1 Tax=Rhododendron molle TaxID=49168 RepID=A0ACC0LET2_RHOML|nr:hypothetical protein RHMOL_Rhmol12G0049700 [Rhododendron molle]
MSICLEGGDHVLDESTHYSSDLRPTAKQLGKSSIGVLKLGIIDAWGLSPMKTKDGKETTDPYCVAKYGQKWVRTRTITDSSSPKWYEKYNWEVFDPCTVITIGVFDNCDLHDGGDKNGGAKDSKMGKLEAPATQIVSTRLSRAEPPLREEVVEYMLDAGSHMWNMRRSKANFFRILSGLSVLFAVGRWFDQICSWKEPITTVLIHVLFLIVVLYPKLILPTIFLYLFLIGVWNYRWRPRHPPHMDIRLSGAGRDPRDEPEEEFYRFVTTCLNDTGQPWYDRLRSIAEKIDLTLRHSGDPVANPDELEEEFDTFPTTCLNDVVRMRYDRLRSIAGRIETVVGDLATQGDRLQSLLSWQDPRLTALFYISCLVAAIVLYVTPFQVVALLAGFYVLRHPRFRHRLPSVPLNLFRRLPARTDCML